MITKITLKNAATYGEEETVIDSLKKINFFYGGNGSGKTTITKVISDVSNHPDCNIEWRNNRSLKSIVFNEDFVKENFSQPDSLKGIFTLGADAKETENKIQTKKTEIDTFTEKIDALKQTLTRKLTEKEQEENSFKTKCWNIKKKYDEEFKDTFTGTRNSEEKFKKKIIEEFSHNTDELRDLEYLKNHAQIVFKKDLQKIDNVDLFAVDDLEDIEKNEITKTKIIGKQDVDIAKMIHKLQNHDWVKQGKTFYDKNYDEAANAYICPFCQSPTDESFRKQLEDYFDEAYSKNMDILENLITSYKEMETSIVDYLNGLSENKNDYISNKTQEIEDKKQIILRTIKNNLQLLEKKEDNPSISIELEALTEMINSVNKIITSVNNKIDEHNAITENQGEEQEKLKSLVWKYITNELEIDYDNYITNISDIEKATKSLEDNIRNAETKIIDIKKGIGELEKQIKSIKPTIDSINKILSNSGFKNFLLKPTADKKHYIILRPDGNIAKKTLSEGERSFIVFLYFYHLLEGVLNVEDNINEDRIVIIDDPVSSLDSEVLFIVSTLIKQILVNARNDKGSIKQIFVLTHNTYFFKEVSFISNRDSQNDRNDTMYFIVRKIDGLSEIDNYAVNPIKTTYHLLWQEIKKESIDCISLQNSMRRILEHYFKILGGISIEKIIDQFSIKEEQLICRSLLSWINEGSHEVFDDINISMTVENSELYKQVFRRIFEIEKQINHYNLMMNSQ
ncbi:MAG: AAA family ATPase [Melioribacteraceae bacterium]|nr:AAA family ATPase [Melioribacteraceae bacterium]MCF8396271.1 AAA family ATPase [Melioribacteraceae bacterium]MCF8421244.1 AAA family ATPase [Melioribacteraceae bacterium]